MESKNCLKWGIVSAGLISNDFTIAMKSLPKNEHQIVGISARNIDKAIAFARKHEIPKHYGSYEELGNDCDIDIIYIGVINSMHYAVAEYMLNHGKHVLCEKPLCVTYQETYQLVQLAKAKGLFLMEGMWTRFFPAYEKLLELLESPTHFGVPMHITANLGVPICDVERIKSNELGGGTLLDLGVYLLQLTLMVFGHHPKNIKTVGHVQDGIDTNISYILEYDDGKMATLTSHSKILMENSAYIYGTEGYIEIEDPFWCPTKLKVKKATEEVKLLFPLPSVDIDTEGFNFTNSLGLHYEIKAVRNCINQGLIESPHWTHNDSLTLAKWRDEIRRSVGVSFPQDLH